MKLGGQGCYLGCKGQVEIRVRNVRLRVREVGMGLRVRGQVKISIRGRSIRLRVLLYTSCNFCHV